MITTLINVQYNDRPDRRTRSALCLGHQGENGARQIAFNLADMIADYGEGTVTLLHMRGTDPAPYIIDEAAVTAAAPTVTWTISDTDTAAAGYGLMELRLAFTGTGGESLAKSVLYGTVTYKALAGETEIPSAVQSWYDALIDYIDEHCIAREQLAQAVADYIEAHPLEGLPAGGTEGQILVKRSGTDYDAEWSDGLSDVKSAINDKASVIINTASGAMASFDDGADAMPVKALTVNIEPVQAGSGDPSPDNVRPISGHAQVIVYQTGKNSCDVSKTEIGTAWNSAHNIDRARMVIPCKPSTTYTLSMNGTNNLDAVYCNNGASIPLSSIGTKVTTTTKTFTTDAESKYIVIAFNKASIIQSDIDNLKLQLELGTTVTAYEPYQGEEVTIDLGDTIYGGTLDVTTGVLTVDMVDQNLGNNTTWVYSSDGDYFKCVINDVSTASERIYLCSNYKITKWTQSASELANAPDKTAYYQRSNKNLFIKDSSYGTDVAALKAAMSGVQLVYELANPIEITLTPTQIETLLGINNIWADAGTVDVDYCADTKLYIQNIHQPTEDDMTADTQIESGKYFLIGNTLYLSTTTIPAGDTIIPGTNCTKTNLAAALNALNI